MCTVLCVLVPKLIGVVCRCGGVIKVQTKKRLFFCMLIVCVRVGVSVKVRVQIWLVLF
jgi:hypothetical protein